MGSLVGARRPFGHSKTSPSKSKKVKWSASLAVTVPGKVPCLRSFLASPTRRRGCRDSWPSGFAAGSGHWLPPRADWPRKRLPQWRNPGMKRTEIGRKFDEIVAFAEVEKFTDTPVKHYSSGMYLRLAFVAAAHLEPEILLVDEVLAVGDSRFQRKCL